MNYTIQNDDIQITVRTYGAELISLKSKQGTEYIWQRKPEFWNRCAPVLFPVVGRLLDKYTIINKQKYEMDIHGFLKDQEFSLLSQTNHQLSLINRFNDATLSQYPFKYEAEIHYTLSKKQVRTEFIIRNIDDSELFFNLGVIRPSMFPFIRMKFLPITPLLLNTKKALMPRLLKKTVLLILMSRRQLIDN